MQVQAITKNVRMSAQKMREVVRQIQGMHAAHAQARQRPESVHLGHGSVRGGEPFPRGFLPGGTDRGGDRVLRGALDRGGVAEQFGGFGAGRGDHRGYGHPAAGDGAGLVEHDGVICPDDSSA